MRKSKLLVALLAGVAGLAFNQAANATLNCTVLIDNAAFGSCATSNTGAISFSGSNTLFSDISLTGSGVPILPTPDLSSVTLDVSSSSTFTGTHTLTLNLYQSGISAPAGTTIETTATINGLINLPGPTTLSDFVNGTASTLGTTLRSATFPATFTGAIGPFFDTINTAITADAQQYSIVFTAPNQSANDTIQMFGVTPQVPEPASLALLGSGLLGMVGFLRYRRRRT